MSMAAPPRKQLLVCQGETCHPTRRFRAFRIGSAKSYLGRSASASLLEEAHEKK